MRKYLLFFFSTINYIRATLEPQKCSIFSQFLYKYVNTRKHFFIFINTERVTESTCTPRVSGTNTWQSVFTDSPERTWPSGYKRQRRADAYGTSVGFASAGSYGVFWRYFVSSGAAHPEVSATGSERSFPGNRCPHCLLSKVG